MTFTTSMEAIGSPKEVTQIIQCEEQGMKECELQLTLQASKLPFARYDFPVKIALLGDSGCGKTSLLVRYSDDSFHDFPFIPTVAVDFRTKLVQVRNQKIIKLQIWDIGAKSLDSNLVGDVFLQNSSGIIICFDVTNRKSFDNLAKWMQMNNNVNSGSVPIIVGCKAGEDFREVSRKEAEDFASIVSAAGYFETSSKLGLGVKEVFQEYSEIILSNKYLDGDHYEIPKMFPQQGQTRNQRRTRSMVNIANNMVRGTSTALSSAKRKLSTMSTDFSRTKITPMTNSRPTCCSIQ